MSRLAFAICKTFRVGTVRKDYIQ